MATTNIINDKEEKRAEYNFQNKTFKLKKRNLKVREDTMYILKDFQTFAKDWTGEFEEKMLEIEDKESKEYLTASKKYGGALYEAMVVYFTSEERCKNLFQKVLDGDVAEINYDAEDDADYYKLLEFASRVFTDFFFNTFLKQK